MVWGVGKKSFPETLKYVESQNSKQQRINKHKRVTIVSRQLMLPVAFVFAESVWMHQDQQLWLWL